MYKLTSNKNDYKLHYVLSFDLFPVIKFAMKNKTDYRRCH